MSRTKMKRRTEIASRIRGLRKGQNQAEFARLLGVSGSQVSAWETDRDTPNADSLVRLGTLASPEEAMWFYRQAGIDTRKLLAAAEHRLQTLSAQPQRGEVVLVPLYKGAEGSEEEAGSPLVLPARFVPSLGSTFAFTVDRESAGRIFTPGDIVVLDASDTTPLDLLKFWDQAVLVKFSKQSGANTGHEPWIPERGLGMGILRSHSPHVTGGDWIANLEETLRDTDKGFYTGRLIGYWTPKSKAARESEEQARRKMKLHPRCRILGRVLFWIRASEKKAK